MASITGIAGTGHSAWARWSLTALLRRLQSEARSVAATTAQRAVRDDLRPRRRYPAQRDRFIESAAMAREMHRL
jgi:hypothetical protein